MLEGQTAVFLISQAFFKGLENVRIYQFLALSDGKPDPNAQQMHVLLTKKLCISLWRQNPGPLTYMSLWVER